jgi:CheY-like chemotaxis protein
LRLMPATRILCVDDDPRITTILPQILSLHGYDVVAASSVGEAVNLITSQRFDVLISDLNMGHAADGFTVVHTMRRVNPECINFILTGYPAFESALQALREQVDDYLSKPSDIPKLVEAIESRLARRKPMVHPVPKRLSTILRDNVDRIAWRALVNMKANPSLAALPLSDPQRVDAIAPMLRQLADHLDSDLPNDGDPTLISLAAKRGEERASQHYPLPLLIHNERLIMQVINNVIYENLLAVNLSYLLLDLNKLNDALLMQLEITVASYLKSTNGVNRNPASAS